VAVSALGRLGGEQSLATLAGLVDHAPAEVVDAALVALSLLKSPAATALLQEIAQGDDAEVSLRAKQLLGSPADLPGKATSF
jgi:HEAT repeat protein